MPELVIALAAVRRGALNLAVGNILGGNCFDVLFLAAADAAYRGGSLYHAVSGTQIGWLALGILLNGVLLLGMLRRQRHGPGNIGFEGVLVLAMYALGVVMLFAGKC
jgi:cation:H+ antiporter